jgi:hypothetical protein
MAQGSSILDVLINNRIADNREPLIVNNIDLGYMDIKNLYGAQTVSSTPTTSVPTVFFDDLGNSGNYMCVRIFHGDLTINQNVTFSPPWNTKGMFILVKGNLIMNNGSSISMTGKGSAESGQDVYLWGSQYVPAVGGAGANGSTATSTGIQVYSSGSTGAAGSAGRKTGGGGSGGASTNVSGGQVTSGKGGAGTSFSGGAGSGGVCGNGAFVYTAPDVTGVTGSNAYVRTTTSTNRGASGGTGVIGGQGRRSIGATGIQTTEYTPYNGNSGAGGLLMVVCLNQVTVNGSATISSNGITGLFPPDNPTYPFATGGASGGGSVNVLYRTGTLPTLQANGGAATASVGNTINGGAGGAGVTTPETFATNNITYPRRWLLNAGGTLYYRNFITSQWVTAPGTGDDRYLQYGMFDGEIEALTKTEFAQATGFNPLSLELKAYMP